MREHLYYDEGSGTWSTVSFYEGVTIKGWVARDKDGDIGFFEHEPDRDEEEGVWCGFRNLILPRTSFSTVTWETGAVKIKMEASVIV